MTKLILKAILYRLGSFILSFIFCYVVFGDAGEATIGTIIIELLHTLWYIGFEKMWKKIKKIIFK